MCIAILKRSGTRSITDEEFDNCWAKNDDGFGCIWQEKKGKKMTVNTYKTLDKEEAKAFFDMIQAKDNVFDIAFHFRIGTSWYQDLSNCHPFYVWQWYYMIHNWVMRLADPFGEKSDTHVLSEMLQRVKTHWHKDEDKLKELWKFATGSKLVFMNAKNSFIVNEKGNQAHEEAGIWWSNYSYMTYKAPVYTPPVNNYKPYTYKLPYTTSATATKLSKIDKKKETEIMEFWRYKSGMQWYLNTKDEKRIMNGLTMEEHNRLWSEYMDEDIVSYEKRMENMHEFLEFALYYCDRWGAMEKQLQFPSHELIY